MSQDDSNFSLRLLSIKEEVLSAADTDSLFTDAISSAESSITDVIGSAEFTIQVATIKIIEGKVEIPITITLLNRSRMRQQAPSKKDSRHSRMP